MSHVHKDITIPNHKYVKYCGVKESPGARGVSRNPDMRATSFESHFFVK